MGRHAIVAAPREQPIGSGGDLFRPLGRPLWTLPLFAFSAALSLLLVSIVDPYSGAYANVAVAPSTWGEREAQQLTVAGGHDSAVERDSYTVTKVEPAAAAAPAAGVPDPGTAKAIARDMVAARGWNTSQYDCLVALWTKESNWNVYASNPSSGAYGIPQALPGTKMASAGADWATNPATQIAWGLGYIKDRYGSPCAAWSHSQQNNWY